MSGARPTAEGAREFVGERGVDDDLARRGAENEVAGPRRERVVGHRARAVEDPRIAERDRERRHRIGPQRTFDRGTAPQLERGSPRMLGRALASPGAEDRDALVGCARQDLPAIRLDGAGERGPVVFVAGARREQRHAPHLHRHAA